MVLIDSYASESEKSDVSSEESEEGTRRMSRSIAHTPLSSVSSPQFSSNLKTIPCTYSDCNKYFNRPAKLAQHLRSHTNTRPFVCSHLACGKDFLRESHLKHHVKSQHSDVRDYICTWKGCGKSFITGTRLRRHNAVHEGENKIRCTVLGCEQVFRKHGTMQRHVLTVHEEKSPFLCDLLIDTGEECGAGFDNVGKLKSHQGRMHGVQGVQRFQCTKCSSSNQEEEEVDHVSKTSETKFSTYTELQAHIRNEHPPVCAECGSRCKTQRQLKSHIDIIHGSLGVDERRIHACAEPGCGRGFTSKGNLTAHVQGVHKNRKFVCGQVDLSSLNNVGDWDGSDYCGRGLSTKGNLEEHIRTAHLGLDHSHKNKTTGINRAPRYKTVSSLIRLTGSGYHNESGRDFSCWVPSCEYRFMRNYDLGIHLRCHHGMADDEEVDSLQSGNKDFVPRLTWDGSFILSTAQEIEAEQALDLQFSKGDEMDGVQETHENILIEKRGFGDNRSRKPADAQKILPHDDIESRSASFEQHAAQDHETCDIEMIDPILR